MSMETFQLTPAMVNKMLNAAMSRGGDFAEIFCEYSRLNTLVMEEGILKNALTSIDKGVGIRVVKGERSGYAYTERFDEQAFLNIASTASAIADGQGEAISAAFEETKFGNYYDVADPSSDIELPHKIAWIEQANKHVLAYDPAIKKANISYVDTLKKLFMADTRGRMISDTQPMFRFTISAIAEKNGERQQGRGGDGGRLGFSFITAEKVKQWSAKAAREALLLLDAQQAPAGMMPVVLAAGDSGILLHEAIGHPLEADFNRRGSSAYANRIGDVVADAQCTIIDDGTVPGDRGSINQDDELNESQKTVLIEEGRLRSYMYDEMSARYFDVPSTGNGRRESYKFTPMPRMRTTYMLPGELDPQEIVKSTKKGIFCQTFKGGQVDISNGNFIFVPNEAYLIEDGKIGPAVKNFSLIGNGPDVLSKVTMVGNDFKISPGIWTCGKGQSVPVGVGLPTVKISEMTVGGQ